MSEPRQIWQLKETAKWADDPEARKSAIGELTMQGAIAVPSLEEIMNVTTREDIKAACIDAIKAIKEKNDKPIQSQREEVQEELTAKKEMNLADLPP